MEYYELKNLAIYIPEDYDYGSVDSYSDFLEHVPPTAELHYTGEPDWIFNIWHDEKAKMIAILFSMVVCGVSVIVRCCTEESVD